MKILHIATIAFTVSVVIWAAFEMILEQLEERDARRWKTSLIPWIMESWRRVK